MSIQSVQAGSEGQVEAALAVLRVDGVVCIRGAWAPQQTAAFKEVYDRCWPCSIDHRLQAYDECWAATKRCVAASSKAVWERRVFHHMDSPTGDPPTTHSILTLRLLSSTLSFAASLLCCSTRCCGCRVNGCCQYAATSVRHPFIHLALSL